MFVWANRLQAWNFDECVHHHTSLVCVCGVACSSWMPFVPSASPFYCAKPTQRDRPTTSKTSPHTLTLCRPSWVRFGLKMSDRKCAILVFYLLAWCLGHFWATNIEVSLSMDVTLELRVSQQRLQFWTRFLLSIRRKLFVFVWCCRDVQNINANLRSCQPLICQAQTSQLVENMAFSRSGADRLAQHQCDSKSS